MRKHKNYLVERNRIGRVPIGELTDTVIDMLNRLGVAGSTAHYNVYHAVQEEWRKDIEAHKGKHYANP